MDDVSTRLAKLERLANILAAMVLDDTVMIGTVLPKCSICHTNLATVKHVLLDSVDPSCTSSCDACAARLIVTAGREVGGGTADVNNVVLASIANISFWTGLPNAERTRQVQAVIDGSLEDQTRH